MCCKLLLIGTRVVVKTLCPCLRHELYQVFVPFEVFREHYQVTAFVCLVATVGERFVGHIHLAAYYRFEMAALGRLQSRFRLEYCVVVAGGFCRFQCGLGLGNIFLYLFVVLLDAVRKLLDSEHIAVVCECYRRHTVGNGLFYKAGQARQAVEQ